MMIGVGAKQFTRIFDGNTSLVGTNAKGSSYEYLIYVGGGSKPRGVSSHGLYSSQVDLVTKISQRTLSLGFRWSSLVLM